MARGNTRVTSRGAQRLHVIQYVFLFSPFTVTNYYLQVDYDRPSHNNHENNGTRRWWDGKGNTRLEWPKRLHVVWYVFLFSPFSYIISLLSYYYLQVDVDCDGPPHNNQENYGTWRRQDTMMTMTMARGTHDHKGPNNCTSFGMFLDFLLFNIIY